MNVATIKPPAAGDSPNERGLAIVMRRPPPLTGPELRTRLEKLVIDFNAVAMRV